ncbi:CotH kinase family protein [Candidatus Saccharibacteria bacterium]|nr:CotH kinase family protein [Candidatus Saccharibacteria bacterium]
MSKKQRTRKNKTTKKKSTTPIVSKILLLIIIIFIIAISALKVSEFIVFRQENSFPKLEISLKKAPIEQINGGEKSTIYKENTVSFTKDGQTTDYDNVEIKGRGNYTWLLPKRSYQIKFSEKHELFSLPEAKKWILLANYADPSYLRNDIAFHLESLLENPYATSGNFAEVYFDKHYNGLYYITEKVEINKNRVNLKDPLGVIAEIDNLHNTDETCSLVARNGECLSIHDSVNSDNSPEGALDFLNKFNQLEFAIAKKDYALIEKIADIDSFAKYFLLSEFTNNPDAYSSSFFFFMDGPDDKIHAGPGWDFDMSLGNKIWTADGVEYEAFLSPSNSMILKDHLSKDKIVDLSSPSHTERISSIVYDLLSIPEFKARVKEIYQDTLSGKGDELLDYIKNQADYIRPAALRDQERWKLKTNFDDEVDYLIDWVAKRYDHFEQTYGANSSTETPGETIPDPAPESQPPSKE